MKRTRPQTEKSYGIPEEEKGLLPWEFVSSRMAQAKTYWVATISPGEKPHTMPTWGVWLDETFYFGGGRNTRKAKNIARNPQVVIHSESGEDAIILEGQAEEVQDEALQVNIDDAYEAKYGMRHGTPVWRLAVKQVFAWEMKTYPQSATKWVNKG
jgi:nitroimidazol reductase NimA-like FMN-containing flavoprotein (pyridoxamine 5'-phosphate oxidase superfamily)